MKEDEEEILKEERKEQKTDWGSTFQMRIMVFVYI
jgi:hypothetical protein